MKRILEKQRRQRRAEVAVPSSPIAVVTKRAPKAAPKAKGKK